jgi:hypothetical protein
MKATENSLLPKNLEEARKVLWLRNYPRPLGELYDEGYLNPNRLDWAANKAFDPRLKQAAKIILQAPKEAHASIRQTNKVPFELPKSALSTAITLEKARTTVWPFPPFKGQPMGPLVETRQLSFKNLGYAIDNAWDDQVRKAAQALLLVRMNQKLNEPIPSAGFVKVLSSGRSFAEARQLQIALVEGGILGTLLGANLVLLVYSILASFQKHTTSSIQATTLTHNLIINIVAIVILASVFILLGFLFHLLIIKPLDAKIHSYRRGQEGEENVKDIILQTLDGNWTLFQNIQLPGRNKADLDAILMGPPGVWVLEIKNFSGQYRNLGEEWHVQTRKGWEKIRKSPSRQAKINASRLGEFLNADGIKQWVDPAVIWADPESSISVENPSVAVWTLNHLADELGNIWQSENLPPSIRSKIMEKLTKLS